MNLLFILISAFAVWERTADAFDLKHNLLIPPDDAEIVGESFTNETVRWSYKFNSGEPVQVDPSATDLVGLNLEAPFIVTAIFKLTNEQQSCLFSITQGDRTVLNLCINLSSENISTIELRTDLYSPDDSISEYFNVDFKNKWMKVVLYVKDDKANWYMNCRKEAETMDLVKSKDNVPLTKEMKIELAFSQTDQFEGLIEEISIHTNADDETLKHICKMGPWGPRGIQGEKSEKGSTPEIDLYKIKVEKGDHEKPGKVGPEGAPCICVVGPPGPPGQTGIPDTKHINLLIPPVDAELVEESITNETGRWSYKFNREEPVQVDPSATDLVGLNLEAPFIVTAIFKLTNEQLSCLFSITQGDRTVLNLCINLSSQNISNIELRTDLYSPDDSISEYFNVDFKNKWMKVVLYVRDDKANWYMNGRKEAETMDLVKSKDNVPLTKEMKIELAFSQTDQFEGLIEEISIHTNADDETLKHICKMGPWGPRGIQGEKSEKGSTPEIDLYKIKGQKGDHEKPGKVGPEGAPCICVVGPPGPPGQTGIPDTKHINLLIPPVDAELVEESITNETGRWSYKFNSEEPVQVDLSATDLVGLNLAAPFIVTAIFKLTNGQSSCLFSITQGDRTVLNLCINPSSKNISNIELRTDLYSPDDSISKYFYVDFKNKWTKIVLYVRDDKANWYMNCSKEAETLNLFKNRDDVTLTKGMKLQLAYPNIESEKFEGLIEEISLHTNADDETLKSACNMLQADFKYVGDEISKNPELRRPQPLEYNFIKDLAQCRREITVIKDGINEQIKNITAEIEALKSTNEYLVQELQSLQTRMWSESKTSQGLNHNRSYQEKQDKL